MILAKDILTHEYNVKESDKEALKQRDADIINAWLEGVSQRELGLTYEMTEQNVYKIIRNHRSILKLDKDFSKVKRVHILLEQLGKTGDTEKDKLDVIDSLRKEFEGDSVTNIITQFLQIEKPTEIESNNRLNEIQTNK